MPRVVIDLKHCKGCRLCVSVCPKKIIVMSRALGPRGVNPAQVTDASQCTACLNCAAMCPDAAIEILADGAVSKGRS